MANESESAEESEVFCTTPEIQNAGGTMVSLKRYGGKSRTKLPKGTIHRRVIPQHKIYGRNGHQKFPHTIDFTRRKFRED